MRLGETPRLVVTLTAAGLLSGVIIVGAYELTQPRIRANKAKALREAVFQVLPGATRMARFQWNGGALRPAPGETGGEASVYGGWDGSGRFVGWAIPAEGPGFQDVIRLIHGFDPGRRKIVGLRVLESRETPGLGDRILKDAAFVGAFDDLAVEPRVKLVKGGATAPNEVDAITGATISSDAVVRIVNQADALWLPRLPAAGEEPAAPVAASEGSVPSVAAPAAAEAGEGTP